MTINLRTALTAGVGVLPRFARSGEEEAASNAEIGGSSESGSANQDMLQVLLPCKHDSRILIFIPVIRSAPYVISLFNHLYIFLVCFPLPCPPSPAAANTVCCGRGARARLHDADQQVAARNHSGARMGARRPVV